MISQPLDDWEIQNAILSFYKEIDGLQLPEMLESE